jgi:hypothetical protein
MYRTGRRKIVFERKKITFRQVTKVKGIKRKKKREKRKKRKLGIERKMDRS